MKTKAFAGLMTTLLLVSIMLYALPVKATTFDDEIRIGIIGPVGLPHWSPAGMKEGAEMAAKEVNDAGGLVLADGRSYEIKLKFADENALPVPNPDAARSEALRLIVSEKVHFIIGGFRTEVTTAILETCAENKMPFFIDGAATTDLLSATVGANYNYYKYIFRNMPLCSSPGLIGTICYGIQFLVATKLLPIFGYLHNMGDGTYRMQVDAAVLTEDLAWTTAMHIALTDPTKYYGAAGYLGQYINVTYNARIPETATDLTSWLNNVKTSGARILLHVFSGRAGLPLIIQWKELGVQCLPFGINVLAQIQDHWSNTLGKCQYETVMNPSGTGTAIEPGITDTFFNDFTGNYSGRWPIYTAYGAYDTLKGMFEAPGVNPGSLQAGGMNTVNYLADRDDGVIDTQAYLDAVITTTEATNRMAMMGPFKYTTLDLANPLGLWWPHDVYFTVSSMSYSWDRQWTRGNMIQWQLAGSTATMEVIDPINQLYSKKWQLLPWFYPTGKESMADTDTVAPPGQYAGLINGVIDAGDISCVTGAVWLTKPGDAAYNYNGDLDGNNYINIIDVAKVGRDWGKTVTYANGQIS